MTSSTPTKTMSTTPFSGLAPTQVTRAWIAKARAVAASRGDAQFGFRAAKGSPYHTLGYTDPDRGPSIGDSTELRRSPIDEGDWVVRDGRWVRITA